MDVLNTDANRLSIDKLKNTNRGTLKKVVNLYYTNNNPNTTGLYKRQVIEITEYRNSEHGLFYKIGGNTLIQ